MKFRKYEFTQIEWDNIKNNLNSDICAAIVELGFLVVEPTVYDENDNIIKQRVMSSKYSVDIVWKDEELPNFAKYKVWPEPVGVNSFGYDIDKNYSDEYYKLFS